MVKQKVRIDFSYSQLGELGYRYSLMEGGYLSRDLATIVIDNRRPYIREVMQYTDCAEEQHLRNVEELKDKGYLQDDKI
jgi:hypothetical protein